MGALEISDWINYTVETAMGAVLAALCFRHANKHKKTSVFFYTLSGFYACIFMSDLFYMITWIVEDFPFVFSPGDISWVGGILFLITAAMCLSQEWQAEQRQIARKYRLSSLIAPVICIAFNVVYITIYPEILINYLMYAIPMVILSYYALWCFLTSRKDGTKPATRNYHLVVLVWVVIQLFYDLFSTLNDYAVYYVLFVICSWLLTFITAGVYFAAKKGAME
jgi:hypothetical protein